MTIARPQFGILEKSEGYLGGANEQNYIDNDFRAGSGM
jgi:hypothetical protein